MKHGVLIGSSMIASGCFLMLAGAVAPVVWLNGWREALEALSILVGSAFAIALIFGLIIAGGCILENSRDDV